MLDSHVLCKSADVHRNNYVRLVFYRTVMPKLAVKDISTIAESPYLCVKGPLPLCPTSPCILSYLDISASSDQISISFSRHFVITLLCILVYMNYPQWDLIGHRNTCLINMHTVQNSISVSEGHDFHLDVILDT